MISTRALDAQRTAFIMLAMSLTVFCQSAAIALLCGIVFATTIKNPFIPLTKKLVSPCLGIAIVFMGGGMNLIFVSEVGLRGFSYTLVTIASTIALALTLGRVLKVDKELSVLLGVGTAICGGSAIAAVSSSVNAKLENVTVATAIVFLLNAAALFIFPSIGTAVGLSEEQFGLWAALAVHDTSSVVATAEQFGANALMVGTTVKLARALWIAPLTIATAYYFANNEKKRTFYLPWFIVGFVILAAISTYVPALTPICEKLATLAKPFLVMALFLVGANISVQSLKTVSGRGLIHGITLWLIVSVASLLAIQYQLIVF